jgi:Ni,Fe-hydrogenase III large subunit/Ni,Fe-hydrogenase III component G
MHTKPVEQFLPLMTKGHSQDGNITRFEVEASNLHDTLRALYRDNGLKLKIVIGTDERATQQCFVITYVFGIPKENVFLAPFIKITGEEFPSVSMTVHEAAGYELRIASQFGLTPINNPSYQAPKEHGSKDHTAPMRKTFVQGKDKWTPFHKAFTPVEGEGIYEIPVGPIHAGIIEPGHFRFSVAGEEIVLLESELGYVHKGIEKLFETKTLSESVALAERVSGDTSFTHSLAFCQAIEQLSGTAVPKRAQYIRTILSELERVANHLSDIGFMMLDTGFNFGGGNGGRLREIMMRLHAEISGNRYLRGMNIVGGISRDLTAENLATITSTLEALRKDFSEVLAVAGNTTSLQNRLKDTGTTPHNLVKELGGVGIAARAVGIAHDARVDFPYAAYEAIGAKDIETEDEGDVFSRFMVRIKEIYAAIDYALRAVATIPEGEVFAKPHTLKANGLSIGITEGWRGDVVYAVLTDAEGKISRVAFRDPSFLNWPIVEYAVVGVVVPDFPLVNKSFNLSYSGNDA